MRKSFILSTNKANNKITEHRAIFQREMQNSYVNKQTKSANNRKTGKTRVVLNRLSLSMFVVDEPMKMIYVRVYVVSFILYLRESLSKYLK